MEIPEFDPTQARSKAFYKKLLEAFLDGNPIRINRNEYDAVFVTNFSHYVVELYNSLEIYAKQKNIFDQFKKQYQLFKKNYDVTLRWRIYERFVDFLLEINEIDNAIAEWSMLQEEEWEGWNRQFTYRDQAIDRLIQFEQKKKQSIVNGYHIERIAPKGSQLTAFGKRNKDNIHTTIDTILQSSESESFFNLFYSNYSFSESENRCTYPFDYYESFFAETNEGIKTFAWWNNQRHEKFSNATYTNGNATQHFVKIAMRYKASGLLREAENCYRKSIGAKKIGESWISETELYYRVKQALAEIEVIQHGKPAWLGRQHFDIWIPQFNCAIEYQGEQHDMPVKYFGGESTFYQNKQRDEMKRQKAIMNNVQIIEVRPGYDLNEVLTEIRKRSNR